MLQEELLKVFTSAISGWTVEFRLGIGVQGDDNGIFLVRRELHKFF